MRLLVQPGDGASPLIKAIHSAKTSIEIAIFRFDQREIEMALAHAVSRGVAVRALIAHTNRSGEQNLRKLELRLLAAGVTVARTADDLERYHGKLMIVDHRELYVLAFNLTYVDIEGCRSFGAVTRSQKLVREAGRLFEADSKRIPYEPGADELVVSPGNARRELGDFIAGARKELLIYDPKISDSAMIRLLEERARAGVEIRIIGKVTHESSWLAVRKLSGWRLHTRTMIRDGQLAFIGSQSLRGIELDMRREIGIVFRDAKVVDQMVKIFREDWLAAGHDMEDAEHEPAPATKFAKKVAKAVARELPAQLAADAETVKEAVRAALRGVVEEAVMHNGHNGAGAK